MVSLQTYLFSLQSHFSTTPYFDLDVEVGSVTTMTLHLQVSIFSTINWLSFLNIFIFFTLSYIDLDVEVYDKAPNSLMKLNYYCIEGVKKILQLKTN